MLGWGTELVEYFLQELELITWPVIINNSGICYMFVCVVPSSHARARRKSASDFSFILYFSNASDSLKVQDASPAY